MTVSWVKVLEHLFVLYLQCFIGFNNFALQNSLIARSFYFLEKYLDSEVMQAGLIEQLL